MKARIAPLLAGTLLWLLPCALSAQETAESDAPDHFTQLDKNSDGQLTEDEIPDEQKGVFKALLGSSDEDGNGQLSADEFKAGLAKIQQTPPAAPFGDPSKGFPGGPMGMMSDAIFKALDADGDGTISADEIANAAETLKALDTDGDGAISRQETMPQGAGQGFASGPGAQIKIYLKRLDTNGDGKLTEDEVPEGFKAQFGTLDADGDGSLDESELEQGMSSLTGGGAQGDPEKALKAAMKHDKDGDGKLSADEAPEAFSQFFDQFDKDKDGLLDEDELKAAAPALAGAAIGGGAPGQGFQGAANPEGIARNLMKRDEDGDGKLSKEELPEGLQASFEQLDADKDGLLDEDEIKQGIGRLAQGGSNQMIKFLMEGDKDGDGKLSSDELPMAMRQFLKDLDTDLDGMLDVSELQAGLGDLIKAHPNLAPGKAKTKKKGKGKGKAEKSS